VTPPDAVPADAEPGDASSAPTEEHPVATTPAGEVARLAAERDVLAARVAALETKVDHRGRLRRTAVGVLVVLTVISLMASTLATWTKRNVLETDRWMEHVGPLAEDPAVQAVITARITARIMDVVDPQALFEEVLPERGQLLAIPLSSAVESFVGDQVASFVASERFAELWVAANERAHATAVKVLEGESEVVRANSGSVTLDLIPIVDAVLLQISELSPDIFGQTIDIPTITVDDLPEDSIAKLNAAFDLDLPEDYGQITVYDDGTLSEVQTALDLFQKVEILLAALTLALYPLCIWLSRTRRRTILQLAVGSALGIVLIRRLAVALTSTIVDDVKGENEQAAVQAVIDGFLGALLWGTGIILAVAVAVTVIAAVTGPYGWAVRLRHGVVRGGVAVGHAMSSGFHKADEVARDDATAVWLVEHKAAVQAGGAAVAVLILLIFDLSWFWTLVLLVLLGAFEVAASRLGGDAEEETGGPEDDGGTTPTPSAGAVTTA
jgi:hypothetical protein